MAATTVNSTAPLADNMALTTEVVAAAVPVHWATSMNYSTSVILMASYSLLLAVGVLGLAGNGLVLFVLLYYRLAGKNTTNRLITNQSVLYLVASIGLVTTVILQWSGAMRYESGVGGWIVCHFFDTPTLIISSVYAANMGAVMITFERYVKIVHPVRHRNHFRPWMTNIGIVVPWMNGLLMYLANELTMQLVSGLLYVPFQRYCV